MININNVEWNKLTLSDIETHLKNDSSNENFFFEYKEDDERPEGVAKEICAFSNTYGGYVIIGVNDNKEITGCNKWNEQRIASTIYGSITSIPVFDVKQFSTNSGNIYIVKVEEGIEPPYITNKGYIYERISSSSCPIKDSNKITQLYYKRADNIKKMENKIHIDDIDHTFLPNNVCAVLDIGFVMNWSDISKYSENYRNINIDSIAEIIKNRTTTFGISKLGQSYCFYFGEYSKQTGSIQFIIPANLMYFIEIMADGSAKFRIPIFMDEESFQADISSLYIMAGIFKDIYQKFLHNNAENDFICANRYESLKVFKPFKPVYKTDKGIFMKYLNEHESKYGGNMIFTSNRIPKNDLQLIDKRYFNTENRSYSLDNLLRTLFWGYHLNLGYIAPLKTD